MRQLPVYWGDLSYVWVNYFTLYFILISEFLVFMELIFFFSAMYIVFQNTPDSPFQHPIEAVMGMFMMSLGEFGDYYEAFDQTEHPILSKVNHCVVLLEILCFCHFYFEFLCVCVC